MEFSNSETKINLLKAFAGESQARNRYTFSARTAAEKKLYVVSAVFKFTAKQERAHAKVFYDCLKDFSGENIAIEGSYPIDNYDNVEKLLKAATHNEYEECDNVYKDFARVADEEGFSKIGAIFKSIAAVEKVHAERFEYLAKLMEEKKLFVSDVSAKWMCLKCGYIYEGTNVPEVCPVCEHDKGYFIRLELAPFSK